MNLNIVTSCSWASALEELPFPCCGCVSYMIFACGFTHHIQLLYQLKLWIASVQLQVCCARVGCHFGDQTKFKFCTLFWTSTFRQWLVSISLAPVCSPSLIITAYVVSSRGELLNQVWYNPKISGILILPSIVQICAHELNLVTSLIDELLLW